MSFPATVPGTSPLGYMGTKVSRPIAFVDQTRNPNPSDAKNYDIGTVWLNRLINMAFILTSKPNNVAFWLPVAGGVGSIVQVSTSVGGPVLPVAGNINLLGTVNQITSVGAGATVTLGLSNVLVAPGSLTVTTSMSAGTGITATTGDITATNGNLVLGTAGNKIISTSVAATAAAGANSFGSVPLVGGTVTVSTTAVTANSLIHIWRQSVGATGANPLGILSVGTIVAGVSFDINAWSALDATVLQATDVSIIGWEIIN